MIQWKGDVGFWIILFPFFRAESHIPFKLLSNNMNVPLRNHHNCQTQEVLFIYFIVYTAFFLSFVLLSSFKHFSSLKQDPVQYHMLNLIMSLFYHLFSGVYVGNYL